MGVLIFFKSNTVNDVEPFIVACLLLESAEILVLGYSGRAALYNISGNIWTYISCPHLSCFGGSLVSLGRRVFSLGINSYANVEEFIYHSKTW